MNQTDEQSNDYEETNSSPKSVYESRSESIEDLVILSLQYKKRKLAAACYKTANFELLTLGSIEDHGPEFKVLQMLMDVIKPMAIVTCATSTSLFSKAIQKIAQNSLMSVSLDKISPKHFNYSTSLNKVLSLNIRDVENTANRQNYILSALNMTDERLISAIGGLLSYISVSATNLQLHHPFCISEIKPIKFESLLLIDDETYKSLQIFNPLQHPSNFKWSSNNTNEGLCMYNLIEKNTSPVGLNKLRSFMSMPICDIVALQKRHEVINFCLKLENLLVVQTLKTHASQISSPTVLTNYLERINLRGGHWKIIYRIIFYTISYSEVCKANSKDVQLFAQLGAEINDVVYSMVHNLENTIDLVNIEKNEQFVIKHGFFAPLDEAKLKFANLTQQMDDITPNEFDVVPEYITQIKLLYIPELKFILSVPFWKENLTQEELQLPNLHFLFVANKIGFYKTPRCYELDQLLGDVQAEIIKHENNVIRALIRYLKKNIHHIVLLINRIIDLECIFALGKTAKEWNFVQPNLVSEKVIDIINGWHPLLKVHIENCIPNDLQSNPSEGLVNVVFGPNASGKTIYLKQIGLITYLAHIGSFVPAESSTIGLLNRIYARVQESESVVSKASSFMLELRSIAYATNRTPPKSLLILDELGKGSSELNCSAIVISSILHFIKRDEGCPHVLISTHLSDICDYLIGQPLFSVKIMDYTVCDGDLVFLHKIKKSCAIANYVFGVIETLDPNLPFVKTAKSVLEALRTGENCLPYGEYRIKRSIRHMKFVKKFSELDMSKPGYLEKLVEKIKRYYEKGGTD